MQPVHRQDQVGCRDPTDRGAGFEEADTDTQIGWFRPQDATSLTALLSSEPSPLDNQLRVAPSTTFDDKAVTPYSFSLPSPPRTLVASMTVLHGPEAGRVFVLEADSATIGRFAGCTIQIEDSAVSRKHARVSNEGGEYYLEDLQSKNGTFIGTQRVERARLYTGDRVFLGPNVTLRFGVVAEDEVHLQHELFAASTWDGLTGALNRETVLCNLDAEVEQARRSGTALSLLLLDIDHFKAINDTFGHRAGDGVLQAIVLSVRPILGPKDLFGRVGGEEFVIVAPGCPRRQALDLAERVRAQIAGLNIEVGNGSISVTASVGLASLQDLESQRATDLLDLADERMYAAKAAGRNRVCESSREGPEPPDPDW